MTARQALAAMMLKDVLDTMRTTNRRRRELTYIIDNHIQKADDRHEELKKQIIELPTAPASDSASASVAASASAPQLQLQLQPQLQPQPQP